MSDGEKLVEVAKPLEKALFLFNQPPGMSSAEMRKKAAQVFGISIAIIVFVFAITPTLMREQGPLSRLGFFAMLMVYGSGFLLLPASLFRIIYGVTDPNDGNGIIRGMVGFVLFLITCFASCVIYGQVTG